MSKQAHLYMIINKINNKKYIGVTTQNPPEKRWIGHKTVARRKVRSTHLYQSINKYGEENFIFIVLASSPNKELIYELEKDYINLYNTQDKRYGYNLANGGEINEGFTIPEHVRIKKSQNTKGEKAYWFGKNHTEETKRKISKAKKGTKMSEEAKEKRRETWRKKKESGYMWPIRGENHHCYGRKRTDDEKSRIQLNTPHRKEFAMIDKDTLEIIKVFISKSEAARWLIENSKCSSKNTNSIISTLGRAVKMNSVSYGYRWKEIGEDATTIP